MAGSVRRRSRKSHAGTVVFVLFLAAVVVGCVFAYRVLQKDDGQDAGSGESSWHAARSEITIEFARAEGLPEDEGSPARGQLYTRAFEKCRARWRDKDMFAMVLQQYRANNPSSTVADKELLRMLADSTMELDNHTRIATITVRSENNVLAAALVNAYAESIACRADEENGRRGKDQDSIIVRVGRPAEVP